MGEKGIQHVRENYNFETFSSQWVDFMLGIHEKYGSHETRKGYNRRWELREI